MDPIEAGPPSHPSPEAIPKLAAAVKQLQVLVVFTALGMLLVCFALCWFLSKQVRITRNRIADEQPGFTAMVSNYRSTSEPLITNFLTALQKFAYTNRDFQPVLNRYRPALGAYLPPEPAKADTRTNTAAPPKPPR